MRRRAAKKRGADAPPSGPGRLPAEVAAPDSARRAPKDPGWLDPSVPIGIVSALWVNGTMLYGLLVGGWSPASVLVLYWLEHACRLALGTGRIALHRQLTGLRGHDRLHFKPGPQIDHGSGQFRRSHYGEGSFVGEFALLAAVSEIVAVGGLIFAMHRMPDWTMGAEPIAFARAVMTGNAWVVLVPVIAQYAAEALTLGSRPFAWLRTQSTVTLRSANLVLFAFLLTMLGAYFFRMPNLQWLAVILIASKLLYECSLVLAGRTWEERWVLSIDSLLWRRDKRYAEHRLHEDRLLDEDELPRTR